MADKPSVIRVLRPRLKNEIEREHNSANESGLTAPNSYGAGFDSGRLSGLMWALRLIDGELDE